MIYVIGGSGFVGSAVVRECQRLGLEHQVLTIDNIDSFTGTSCSLLINANGNSKKYLSERDPIWDFDASVRSVRKSLVDITADKYIMLSSCDVYPDCSDPSNTKEDQIIDITKQSAYGFHKYLAEMCVIRHAKEWIVFRMGGFVGPNLSKNAIYDILNTGELWLDPKSELQFINTDEAAGIIVKLALSDINREIFNLCGTGVIKLEEVVQATGKQIQVRENSPNVHYEVNTDKLRKLVDITHTRDAVLKFAEESING